MYGNEDTPTRQDKMRLTPKRAFLAAVQFLAMGLLALLAQPLCAQGLPAEQRINGKLVWEAFEPQREVLQQSSAVIYTGGQTRIKSLYGMVVSEHGHILTKASEIESQGDLRVRIGAELYADIDILGVEEQWDIAMLKVNADAVFKPVSLSEHEDVQLGHWVVSNGSATRSQRRVRVGIVSSLTRAINIPVILGVEFSKENKEDLTITKLSEQKGAAKAGLKVGDVLLTAGGSELKNRMDLHALLKTQKPGNVLTVEVMRGEERLRFDVALTAREDEEDMLLDRNEQMSGGGEADQLSKRRSGFPRVIHHDTPLTRVSVGGPLLNLDGLCVGMNIARTDRVTSFAIPARELREIIGRMVK